MADKYTVHNVLLESADFYVLILEFPEEDINDRLSYLVHDKGLVYRHLYEDFLLTSCMANSGPFFFHIRKRPELLSKFAEIRRETLSLVYKYSPGFKPDNIVINQNNVLKTKGSVKEGERVRPLVENALWDRDPPLTGFGPAVIVNAPESEDSEGGLPPIRDGDDEEDTRFRGPDAVSDNPFAGGGSDRDDVPFELKGHKWDTAGVYINIRQYEENEDTLIKLLGGTPFESVRGYHLLVVELCVDDFSDVFHLLDKTDVSKKNKPEDLVAELYEIALIYNPFLRLEDIDLKEVRQEYRRRNRARQRTNNRRMAAASGEELAPRRKGLKFSDLTNEKLLALAEDMKKKIVGQDAALEHISASVHRASVGLKREQEPIGVLLFTGKTGVGKCLAPGTEVLMYDGTIKVVENVKSGDLLMGPDSLPREVLDTCSGKDEMFQIVPTKGQSWACNAPHILTLTHTSTGEIVDMPLDRYLEQNKTFQRLHKLFRVPVDFENKKSVPLDPYFVGLWVGDGKKDLSSIQVTSTDGEVISYLQEMAERFGLNLSNYEKRDGFCPAWALTNGNVGGKPNPLLSKLRKAVTSERGLAPEYKTSSEKERLALLAGVIDADGFLVNNCYEVCQKNAAIARDVAFIARSLGFMVTESLKEVDGRSYSRLFISGDTSRIPVKIGYKKAAVRKQIKDALRTGFSVEHLGLGKYYGFTLSGDGRFLLGDFTVTHNTETAKVLADTLGAHLVRIDCQEYQHFHEVAKLSGSPPGYIGYDDGGHLTKELAKYPFSVVLFDEIEKAHSHFHERILQIIDDGVLTEAKGGKKVPFNQALVVMTSNVGVKEVAAIGRTAGFGEVATQTDEKAAKAREEALKHKFKPEFLNRVDEIVHFRDLDKPDYTHILDILLDEVNEQLTKSRTLLLKVSAGAKNFLLEQGIDKKFGARPLRRAVKKHLSTPLARAILGKEIPGENGKITVNLKPSKDGLAFKGTADTKPRKKAPEKEDD